MSDWQKDFDNAVRAAHLPSAQRMVAEHIAELEAASLEQLERYTTTLSALVKAGDRISQLEALLRCVSWCDDGSWPRDLARAIDAALSGAQAKEPKP